MSEQHRVAFTTLESSKKQSKSKPKSDTVRITINLTEPSSDSCPVFSYTALVNSVERKKKKENEKVPNGSIDHIHDCDEDQLKKIAQQYEDKYGTKENRFSNYKELGAGYDNEDSFIDNSEALDEALSEQVEPEHGGYYVNVGRLQLKHLDGSENSDDEELNVRTHHLKRAAKAIVSDSEEEDSEDEEDDEEEEEEGGDSREDNQTAIKEDKLPINKAAEPMDVDELKSATVPNETDKVRNKSNGEIRSKKKQKRKLDSNLSDHPVEKKKKKFSKSITVKKLLEEKRIAEAPSECADKESLKKLHNSVSDVIESVINASRTDNSILDKDSDISNGSKSSSSLSRNGDMNDLREKAAETSPPALQVPSLSTSVNQMNLSSNPYLDPMKDIVPLPPNLPEDILELIKFIKESTNNCQNLGKSKFFSPSINSRLLSLERKCRDLPSRQQIYAHLACFAPCGKETLMKRAKKLLIDHEEEHIEKLINKLKFGVDRIMPSLLEKHSEACQKASKEKYIEDSVSGCASSNSESRPKSKVPRRVFPWDDELKSYVRQIIETRLRIFKLVKSRKDTAEDFVQSFVSTKLKGLWPQGWMKVSTLLKVADTQLTNFSKRNTPTVNYHKKLSSAVNNASNLSASTPNLTPAATPAATPVPENNSQQKRSSVTLTPISNSFKDKFKQNEASLPEIDMFSDPIDLLSKITSAISPNSQQQQQNSVKPSSSPQMHNTNINHQTSPSMPKHEKHSSSVLVENKKPATDGVISKNNSFNIDHLMDFSKKEPSSSSVNSSSNCRAGSQSYPKSSNDQVLDLSPVKTPVSQNHKNPETEGAKPVSLKHRILQESMKAQAETDMLYIPKESKPPKTDYEKLEVGSQLISERDVHMKTDLEYREDLIKSTYDDIKEETTKYKTEAELEAERRMIEETMTATDVLNQIINESLQDISPVVHDDIKPLYQNESMKPPLPIGIKEDPALQERRVRSQSVEECEASMEAVIKNLQDLQKMSGNKSNSAECNFSVPASVENPKYNNNSKNLKPNDLVQANNKVKETQGETASIPKVSLGFQAEFYKHLLGDPPPPEKTPVRKPEIPNLYPSHEDHLSKPTDPNLKSKDQNYHSHQPPQSQH